MMTWRNFPFQKTVEINVFVVYIWVKQKGNFNRRTNEEIKYF